MIVVDGGGFLRFLHFVTSPPWRRFSEPGVSLRKGNQGTYDVYLANGYPVASGVVEGACKHLSKDRMECLGMRWSKEGAQATLDLRAVSINGEWTPFCGASTPPSSGSQL